MAPGWREAWKVEMDEAEIAFLAYMRELAKRGAAATKKLVASRPGYYRALGRRGGQASVASRRARMPAELDGTAAIERPIVEAVATSSETAQPAPRPLAASRQRRSTVSRTRRGLKIARRRCYCGPG
jgi:hypothetical protein